MTPAGTNLLLASADATPAPVDVVTKSLRFNGSDSPVLTRIPSSSGSQTTFTISLWVKRSDLNSTGYETIWASEASGYNYILMVFYQDGLRFQSHGLGATPTLQSNAVFRDVSAWYHIVLSVDTTQATDTDRVKIYVNGSAITFSSATYPTLNYGLQVNTSSYINKIGYSAGTSQYFDGYQADIHFIDGTALTPTSFAEEDATTGQWKPKAFSGTYGTNGFHLDFEDDTAIGNDVSGNNNDFTATNLAASDVMEDTPTDNYCVYNGVFSGASGLSEGNLKCTTTAHGTFDAMSFASYWEIEANTTGVTAGIEGESIYGANTVSVTNGSTFGFRLSAAGALDYTSNGSSWTSIATGLTAEAVFPYVTGGTTTANFGQSTLSYSVPSGYAVLSTGNLPTPTIAKPSEHFNTLTYASSGAKTGVGFQPDLVWVKARGNTYDHELTDSVRGVTKALSSNDTGIETTDSTGLTAFGSDGFTVGAGTNYSTSSMVAWSWKESATAGMDIVTWTGNDDGLGPPAPQSVSHSLGASPDFIVAKQRTANGMGNGSWVVWHKDLTSGKYLLLNTTAGEASWSNALVSSIDATDVSFGSDGMGSGEDLNADSMGGADTYVAYLFATVAGYSKVGLYNGNSSDNFVALDFAPAWILIKATGNPSSSGHWVIKDNKRSAAYNPADGNLYANDTYAEDTTASVDIDLLSNGFNIQGTYAGINATGSSYIFLAMAEKPLKYANAR